MEELQKKDLNCTVSFTFNGETGESQIVIDGYAASVQAGLVEIVRAMADRDDTSAMRVLSELATIDKHVEKGTGNAFGAALEYRKFKSTMNDLKEMLFGGEIKEDRTNAN